jgi:hypothetical protein
MHANIPPNPAPPPPATLSSATHRLLLLRGRLAQSCIELPEGLFDPCQDGDEELMRFALCYNILQVNAASSPCLPHCTQLQHTAGECSSEPLLGFEAMLAR